MKAHYLNRTLLRLSAFGIVTAALSGTAALAQSSLSTATIVGVASRTPGQGISALDEHYSDSGLSNTSSVSRPFTGLDSHGVTQTSVFTGQTTTSANYGILRAKASISVTNVYYNAANPEYLLPDGSVNPAGSGDTYVSLGFADFNDTLQFGGTALQNGYKARYIFHVDGTNTGTMGAAGTGNSAAAGLGVTVDGNTDSFFAFDNGALSTNWVTSDRAINGVTPQTLNAQFSAQAVVDTYNVTEGLTAYGLSDFSSTLTLSAIEVIDPGGNLASGWTVTSGSGTSYPTIQASAPEPGTAALLALALLPGGLYLRSRRGIR